MSKLHPIPLNKKDTPGVNEQIAMGGGNRPGEDGPYRPPNPNEAPPYPPKKLG